MVEKKWHQRDFFLGGDVAVYLGEGLGVARAVVGWQLHAEQQHLRPTGAGAVDHRCKVLLQLRWQHSAQAVVAAQLEDYQLRFMLCKQRRQARLASGTGVAADGCVDHLIVETFALEPLLKQRHPPNAGIQSETGADTIANDQDCTRRCVLGHAHQGQASTQKPHTHRILHGRKHSHREEPQQSGSQRGTILHELSLELNKGDSLAIVGASGSGKSTLLGLLAGLDLPSSGEVTLAGQSLSNLDEDQRARIRAEHVGFVFQSFQLLDSLNALENVMLPLELDGRKDARERATELLRRVGLGQRLTHSPRQLSGGEQQRVAIARAFAAEPDVLFADEPTGNLDSHTGERISDLLFELNKERGTTLVLVTHDERLAHRCRRLIRLEAGLLVAPLEP